MNSCSLKRASYCSFTWQICPFEESVGVDFFLLYLVLTPFCPKEEAIKSALTNKRDEVNNSNNLDENLDECITKGVNL